MATYYVDFVGGDDTNNGTSTSTPWQHCPGDVNATDNADITLSAGDTVVFEGGVTYAGEIIVNASGTSGSRITFVSGHLYETPWGEAGRYRVGLSQRYLYDHVYCGWRNRDLHGRAAYSHV